MHAEVNVLPHSLEAEQAVLGALLIDCREIEEVFEIINEKDFFIDFHQFIFHGIVDLHSHEKPIDPVLLISKLEGSVIIPGKPLDLYIYELANYVPSAKNIISYAEIVRERSVLRELIKIAKDMKENCIKPNVNLLHLLEQSEFKVKKVSERFNRNEVKQLMEKFDGLRLQQN